jgi:SAM-dependent methyltransferase
MYPSYLIDVDSGQLQARVLRLVGRGQRVLELGCGNGSFTRALVAAGCQVVAIEIDREAATLAAPYCERTVVGDMESPLLDEALAQDSFDVVLAADVLEHLRDPAKVLRRVARHIRPGGRLIASLPNVAHGSVRLALLQGRFPYADAGLLDRTHLRFFTRSSLGPLLADAGFVLIQLESDPLPIEMSEVQIDWSQVSPGLAQALSADPEAAAYEYLFVATPSPNVTTGSKDPSLQVPEPQPHPLWQELRALRHELTVIKGTRVWRVARWYWRAETCLRRLLGGPPNAWPPD